MQPRLLRDVLARYAQIKLRRANPLTRRKFEYALNHLALMLGREAELCDLRRHLNDDDPPPPLLAEFQDYLATSADLSEDTCAHYAKKIAALWRFAAERRWIEEFPDIEVSAPPEKVPRGFTKKELLALWQAFRDQNGYIGGVPSSPWWRGLLFTIWDSSERLDAILQLRWEDVDLNSRWGIFRAATRKGKRRDRPCLFHPETIAVFYEMVEPKRELVFPLPHTKETLLNRWGAICRSVGIPDDRYHKTTAVRKSLLSHFAAAGGDATRLADHSSPAVTIRHYLDPRIAGSPQPSQTLFRPSQPDTDPPRAA